MTMDTQNSSKLRLARVFVVGQMTALGFFVLSTAVSDFTGGGSLNGLVVVLIFGLALAGVLYFRLPRLLSERLSLRRLRWVVVIVSALGVAISYDNASSLLGRSEDRVLWTGLGLLRASAIPVLALFVMVLLAVLVMSLLPNRQQ
jgi:K+-transporting ATPase A subunit